MEGLPTLELPDNPRLVANLTYFARALRAANPYWTLHAVFVSRPEERRVFHQVFRLYWRDPRYLEHMMAMMLPAVRGVQEDRAAKPAEKRAAEALLDGIEPEMPDLEGQEEGTEVEIDASFTMSDEERLRSLDFEQMSNAEVAAAKRMLARLTLPVRPLKSRRTKAALHGAQADWRRTMRDAMRTGGDIQRFATKERRIRWPNLVVLCDISGSMSSYSRMVLHFLHSVANQKGAGWARVHGFTFGTRLTNITRHLATRDVDAALAAAGAEAQDWQGGTRIGECLHQFNRDWSRRVMGQGAVVLLITDGLDRDDPDRLAREMERLPLLRWEEFAPKARGIRAMLPHVDSFRAGHNIASLETLVTALSQPDDVGEKSRLMALL